MNSIGKIFRRKTMVIVLSVFFISLLAVSVSYSSFSNIGAVMDNYVVEGFPLTMTFKDDNYIKTTLNVSTDEKGLKSDGKTFSLINNSNEDVLYHVVLENMGSEANKENIKISIDGEKAILLSDLELRDGKIVLTNGVVKRSNEVNDVVTHNIKMWAVNSKEAINFKIDVLTEAATNIASDMIKELGISNPNQESGLLEDAFGNIRYFGDEPNNYVLFNDELWRIIGVFKIVKEDGRIESKIKIVRNEIIASDNFISSTNYSWNENMGLKLDNYLTSSVEGSNLSILDYATYYSGSLASFNNFKATDYYTNEINSKDAFGRDTSLISKIGLLNISDYYYAMADGTSNNWLDNNTDYWLMNNNSNDINTAFYVNVEGKIEEDIVSNSHGIKPVLYLKSTVLFVRGDGSLNNPYVVE